MSRLWFLLLLLCGNWVSAQPRIQLSPPQVQADSVLFEEAAMVRLALDYPGVQLRYTLNGSSVLPESPRYDAALQLKETATVRARAFHPHFAESQEVSLTIRSLKRDLPIKAVAASPSPAPQYAGAGLPALTDRQKGSLNFSASPTAWLGWETDTLHLNVQLESPSAANQLTLSLLDNSGAWIMGPAKVEVYASGEQIGEMATTEVQPGAAVQHTFLEVPLKPGEYKALKVIAIARRLPEWHDGAGRPAWIFLDEIFLSQIPR